MLGLIIQSAFSGYIRLGLLGVYALLRNSAIPLATEVCP